MLFSQIMGFFVLTDRSVTAIFAAMTAQYIGSHTSNTYKSQLLFQKLRSNILSLRQFEQCYILARWIRNLFKDMIDRPRRRPEQIGRFLDMPPDMATSRMEWDDNLSWSMSETSPNDESGMHGGSNLLNLLYPSSVHALIMHNDPVDNRGYVSAVHENNNQSAFSFM
jgi:hypothetical protein